MSILEEEARRARWRRYRESLSLTDPRSEDFGRADLGALVPDPSVRLLIVPGDPEANRVTFDSDFWQWWLTDLPDPVTGKPVNWLHESRPTANAALRYYSNNKILERYIALRRNGALEMELGDSATYTQYERKYFRLIYTIGKIWFSLNTYNAVIALYQPGGPWEVTLSLENVSDAGLGNLASEWASSEHFDRKYAVSDQNLQHRVELAEWPDDGGVKSLAYIFGDWIEDAWGSKERRYLTTPSGSLGIFDTRQYFPYR